MKGKNLIIRLSVLVLFITVIFIYFSAYFIPSIKHINLQKRNIKDMKFKIENFVNTEEEISFIDKREREFIDREDKRFKSKIPQVRSKGDFKTIQQNVFKHIEVTAKKIGIFNMIIDFHSPETHIATQSLSRDMSVLEMLKDFKAIRDNELKEKLDILHQKRDPFISVLEELNYFTAVLIFTGNLRNAVNFINHLPWDNVFLKPENLMVSSGKLSPNYIISFKVYYIDLRAKSVNQRTYLSSAEDNLIIDYHSPLLLRPVYETYSKDFIARELPEKFGKDFLFEPQPESKAHALPLKKKEIFIKLNTIKITGEKNFAVINNTLVKTGDYISGLKVTDIKKDAVVLKHKEKEILLTPDQRVKRIKVY